MLRNRQPGLFLPFIGIMDEQAFLNTVTQKSRELGINPLLLLAGVEGLYTFRDVELNVINYEFLDSLILSIFALRIGDEFHSLAEEQLRSEDPYRLAAAGEELRILTPQQIESSGSEYLRSFASLLGGKTNIRNYHVKALDVAAAEIRKAQVTFGNSSISSIVMLVCKEHLSDSVDLGTLFQS